MLVSGPPGEVIGEVLGVATPDEAPHIEGAPPAELIRDIAGGPDSSQRDLDDKQP